MNIFELSAKITADTSDFDSKVGSMVSSGVKKFAALTTAAGAATAAFVGKSVKTGAEFDAAMSQVQATMLKTNEEMVNEVGHAETAYGSFQGNLREFAQFLGENTAFSATQAAEALNYMALAGYDTQESMDMLPNVLSLAAAGNFDLARASDMVTDAQTAFGITAERTTQMVDEMAKTASISNTSVEQMGDAFLVVGGLAKELNGGMVTLADGTQKPVDGLQELEIALGAMANAGIKGSEAGTHMRNMLLKLASPTAEGTKQLEALGVQVFDTEGNMRSLNDIFGDLNGSMSNLTQQEKLQAISDLFNTRDTASAEALLAAVSQDWDEIGEGILNAEGAAADMSKIQLDNLKGDVTLMKSAFEGLQIAISDEVTPSLRGFVQKGTEWLGKLTTSIREGKLHEWFERLRSAIGRVKEALSPLAEAFKRIFTNEKAGEKATELLSNAFDVIVNVLEKVSTVLAWVIDKIAAFIGWLTSGSTSAEIFKSVILGVATGIATLWAIIKGVTIIQTVITSIQSLSGVFMFLAANPIVLVIAAIAALVAALVYLYNNNEEFRTKVQEIWGAIQEFFGTVALAIQTIWQGVVDFFTQAWEAIKIVWDVVVEYFTAIWESIKTIFSVVADVFTGDFQGAWDGIQSIVDLWEGYFSDIWEAIKEVFSPVIDWFSEHFSGAWNAITAVWDIVIGYFTTIWETIKGVFSVVQSVLTGDFQGAWDGIRGIIDLWGGYFSDVWETIKDVFFGVAEWFGGKFEEAWEAIKAPFAAVGNFFSDIWSTISGSFSTGDAYSWGSDLISNFVNGIYSAWGWLIDALSSVASAVASFIGFSEPDVGPLSNFHTFAPDMMDLFAKGVKENEGMLRDQIAKSFDFEDLISRGYDIDATISGTSEAGNGSYGGVEINVYATERQDEMEIAREVQRIFVQWENQRKAAYA